jgi:hypothetical protein
LARATQFGIVSIYPLLHCVVLPERLIDRVMDARYSPGRILEVLGYGLGPVTKSDDVMGRP